MTSNALANAQTLRLLGTAGSLPNIDLMLGALGTGKVNLGAQLSYTNGTYTDRKAVLQIRRDSPVPTAVDAAINVIVSGTSDNTTFKGVSGGFYQARDSAGITSGQRGILYALQLGVAPTFARNNIGIDDADCLVIQHQGTDPTANATDAIYLGHNSLFTSDAREWLTGYTNAANCGYTYRTTGAYFTGADFAGRLTDPSHGGYGVRVYPTIQSTLTGNVYLFRSELNTAAVALAGAYAVSTVHHFSAQQTSIGANSSVGVQIGFNAAAAMVGATTNYGFQSSLPLSGTANWNFYAAGDAPNLFAGSLIVGVGSVANSSTGSLLYLPSTTSGAPTAAPTTFAGRVAFRADETNNKLYAYMNGAWKSVTFT